MARPLTALQAHENRLFLERFALSGNARMAAREVGVAYGTLQHRRKRHSDFAQRWEAAAVAVQARPHLAGGKRGPEASAGRTRNPLRTQGGEPIVVRTRNGRLQIRLAHPGKLTKTAEQAFLYALSATANVRLAAAAAGASAAAFYRRRRQNPAFAREMRLALKTGWERINAALLASTLAESHDHDRWRRGEWPPLPPMTVEQAMQLLHLHEKSVHQRWEAPHRRRRRGESDEVHCDRLQAMGRFERAREAEEAALRRAARFEATGDWRLADEPPPPELVPLERVTGWSRASGRPAHHASVALFGGWRIADMERKRRRG